MKLLRKVNTDFFNSLFINKKEKLSTEDIEQAYKDILEDIEKQKDRIYENNAISMIDKFNRLNKIDNKSKYFKVIYRYCKNKDNLNLRNYILELCDNGQVPRISVTEIEENYENNQKSTNQPTIRKIESKVSSLETPNIQISELEKFELIFGIQATGEFVKKYRIKTYLKNEKNPQEREEILYDIFSEYIDISLVVTDDNYRKNLFRAIEINQMTGDTNYIGNLGIDENDQYMILKNNLINRAVEIYNSIHNISKNHKKIDEVSSKSKFEQDNEERS